MLINCNVFPLAATAKNVQNNLEVIELDTTKDESVVKAVKYVATKEGHIDVVVNNAGAGYYGTYLSAFGSLISSYSHWF